MRYLVKARLKPGRDQALRQAISDGTLGRDSVAGDEFLRNMRAARQLDDGTTAWVEVCFCPTPLEEEREHWSEFFEFVSVHDAHARSHCRHENGTEFWGCTGCDCTERLEAKLAGEGQSFLATLPA